MDGWDGYGAYVSGGWVLKMKLMLSQLSTKLELKLKLTLKLKLSLAKLKICIFSKTPKNFLNSGCPKKNESLFLLNISATTYPTFNLFFLLKTESHTQILNTKPFLCDFWGLRYLQNKIGYLII